jgi:RHS repeat-associated protein
LTYQYDPKGNIINLNDQVNGITHTYGYDPLDRLDWAKGNNGSIYDHDYNYDRIGNITYKSDVGTYSYGNYSVRPHAVQAAGPFTFTYDANGNMTSKTGGGVNITMNSQDWNYDNKPTRIQNGSTIIDFVYDGNSQRVKKISPSQAVFYFGELYELRSGIEILHLFAGSRRIASIRLTDGKNQFYHPNHLGSASVITDQTGGRKEQIEYHPFGTYRDVGSPTGTYDYDATFPDVNYTFTDQEDDELGFYNYGARLYDPLLGRFISPDRLVPDPGDPQALNRYTYCVNNPLIYTDPSGEIFGIDDLLAVVIGAAIGSLIGGATSAVTGGNIWQGMAMGAISGAFMGAAAPLTYAGDALLGVESFLMHDIVQATVYTGMGAASGATNAAISGGNVGIGALSGGAFSLAGSTVGVPNFEPFGSSKTNALAGMANRYLNTSLTGAGYGAAYAGMTGGNVLKGAGMGALGWAAGDTGNMLIGHGVGFIGSNFSAPKWQDGVWIYEGNVSGAITFGNVILGQKGFSEYNQARYDSWQSRMYRHEFGHVYQYQALGPSFLPAYVGQFPVALTVFENPFQFNIFENFFLRGAPTTYGVWE